MKHSQTILKIVASCVLAVATHASASEYAIAKKVALGGEGGWDYLSYDAPSNRLFITRGTRVQVVDPDKGVVVGEIMDTAGVHGVSIAGDSGKGYTSNGRDNSVSVFDMKTLKTLSKISTPEGENPDYIAYDRVSKRVLAFNGRSKNASVIDTTTDKLVATVPLSGKPEAAVADGKGMMFVDIEDKNEIMVIDTRKAAVVATWPLPGCDEPAGLAIDEKARRLFVGCHSKQLLVVNADNGKIVATLPIGEGVDANAFDADKNLIFSSQGDGTLTIIKQESAEKYSVQQTATTPRYARTMAHNPVSHDVYVVTAEFDELPLAKGQTRPQRKMRPDTFALVVMSEKR